MTDTAAPQGDASAPSVTEYPAARQEGCPFSPAPRLRRLTEQEPVAKVRIWDGSTPWLVTRHADQRALLTDPRLSIDEKLPNYPHSTSSLP